MQEGRNKIFGIEAGQIVRCTAGRENGLFMIVCDVVDENFVLLTDGRTRKFISPKKKKIKHIQKTNTVVRELIPAIKDGSVTDKAIRNALSEFCNKGVKNEQK